MALTDAQIQQHITKWENHYRGKPYPYRVRWPSKLFHHCPVQNAASILKDGHLRSRNDEDNAHDMDIAGQEVIDLTNAAHGSSRFYFRPRTPTQFYIEGIRKPSDCEKFGPNAHAPILVMFILKAQSILSLPGTRFSKKNMQIIDSPVGDSLEFFNEIPFEKVYHEGGIDGDYTIVEHRCAEVLAESPVSLDQCLECVCCRSMAERNTLLNMLGDDADVWRDRILVSDDLRVFDRKFAFVKTAEITKSGLLISINRRSDGQNIKLEAKAWNANGDQILDFCNENISCTPPSGMQWRILQDFDEGQYEVWIKIDDHLAAQFGTLFESSLI